MKITAVKTKLANVPFDKPIATAIHNMNSVGCVLLYLETDEDITGESYVFTLNAVRLKVFDEMVRSFEHQLLGKDPHFVGQIWQNIWQEINPIGHKGITISVLSAIDTALWDIIGKAAGLALHKVFGACRDTIKTYASGGLWLSQSIDELLKESEHFLQQGFTAMKIRVGSKNIDQDVERVKILRESVGSEIELMADANQSFTPKQAIRLGRRLEEFNLLWFEEPVAAYDLSGHARVCTALDTDIASGETEYTRYGMKAMIEAKAMDILMPDLQRIGGLSEMRVVANLAASFDIPISTHIFTEHSLSIAGSAQNCISVEHMPWFASLFCEQMEIKNGMIEIPDRPGTGFTFNLEAVKSYCID